MIRYLSISLLTFLMGLQLKAQEIPAPLLRVQQKLDQVVSAQAEAQLTIDISFINMPEKSANAYYQKNKPVRIESEDFAFLPKRGIDFSWSMLFEQPFIAVDRGVVKIDGTTHQQFNIIPNSDKADYAIMLLTVDIINDRIAKAEITTKKEGSYEVDLSYDKGSALPERVIISFEMEKIKIPLNFMGRDTDIDRKSMKDEGPKTGKIYLNLNWKDIILEVEDQ